MAAGGGHEPNLTPFIDLFAVLTCFMLLTAAWIHLESINVKVGPVTSAPDDAPLPPPPKLKLSVTFDKNNFIVSKNDQNQNIPWFEPTFAQNLLQLVSTLEMVKIEFPDEDVDVTLRSSSDVKYGELIRVYDTIIDSGWKKVAISPY